MCIRDRACALLNYGLLHEELFFETCGEFFHVWERLKPVISTFRQRYRNPHSYAQLEKAAKRYEKWMERRAPGALATIRQYMQQLRRPPATR